MNASIINLPVADTAPVPLLTKSSKVKKTIAKLDERQLRLDAAKAKAAQELADADRTEAIEAGQTEFVKAVIELDLTTREQVISTVLESLKNDARQAKIQAWVAAIPEPKPRPDPADQRDKSDVSSVVEPAPAADQSETSSAKPESSVSDPKPTE